MTPIILPARRRHVPDLHRMIDRLCAFHGDTSLMGLAEVQTRLIDGGPLIPLIALCRDHVVGYAVIEPHWRPMDPTDGWDICHLYVEAGQRNIGVGRALIGHIREMAQSQRIARLTIGTAPHNPGAAAAYRAMGLIEITGQAGPRFSVPLTGAA